MKKKLNKMAGRMHSSYNQIPYPLGGRITNWRIIISQKFSHRSESCEPLIKLPPDWGSGMGRRTPSRAFNLEGHWGLIAGAPQHGGSRDSTLAGCMQVLMHTRSQGKGCDFTEAEPDLHAGLRESCGEGEDVCYSLES